MLGEVVTIVRAAATTDPYSGEPTGRADWSHAATFDVSGVVVAPRSSSEPAQVARSSVIVGLTAYLPAGADLRAADRVRVRGQLYDVDGMPGEWRNPWDGRVLGLEVALQRVEG